MSHAGVVSVFEYEVVVLQATIGIDFLSKTMYLEDRTVSQACHGPSQLLHHQYKSSTRHIHIVPLVHINLTLPSHLLLFPRYSSFFAVGSVGHVIMVLFLLVPIFIASFLFSFHPLWRPCEPPPPTPVPTFNMRLATDSAAALGHGRTGAFPQPHPQLHPRLSCCCGGL